MKDAELPPAELLAAPETVPAPRERVIAWATGLRRRWELSRRQRRRRGRGPRINLRTPSARLFVVLVFTLALLFGGLALALSYVAPVNAGHVIDVSDLMTLATNGQVVTATFYDVDHQVVGTYITNPPAPPPASATTGAPSGTPLTTPPATSLKTATYSVEYAESDAITPSLVTMLAQGGAKVLFQNQLAKALVKFVATYVLPMVLLANLFALIFIATRSGGDSIGGIIQFGRLGKQGASGSGNLTFADVAGVDEAMAELKEVRDYLADPARFAALGASRPRACSWSARPAAARR